MPVSCHRKDGRQPGSCPSSSHFANAHHAVMGTFDARHGGPAGIMRSGDPWTARVAVHRHEESAPTRLGRKALC